MVQRKLNKPFLIQEYDTSIIEARKSLFIDNDIKRSIAFGQYAGYVAWAFPFLKNFCDDNLEDIISEIAKHFKKVEYLPQDKKIVFYNSQIVDNGALTEQYLDFFIENDFQVLFIIPEIKNTLQGKTILEKINKASNINLFISEKRDSVDKIIEIRQQIELFRAQYCFLHFMPNDVLGCVSFLNVTEIKSYYIVHNDHTFWIGKNFFDYFIEFRHLGISIDIERRGIPLDKILHIPFYPIKNEEAFQGFPFNRKDKIVGVSGANLYKYLIDNKLHYFQIIKELIVENPNFIFCLCGWGDIQSINNFIEKNNLQDRFYFLGRRSDFYNLIGQADILFESYPLKGGLTPLFAIEQNIPVIGIASYDNCSGSLEELLNIEDYQQPVNFTEFKAEANKLITDPEYRKIIAHLQSNNPCNKNDFESSLSKVLKECLDDIKPKHIKKLELNDEAYLKEYLNLNDSTIQNLMRMKLFTINSSLSLGSRLKLLMPAIKSSKTKGIYGMIRIIILVFWGR